MAIIYPIYLMKKKKIILISEIAASLVLAILLAVAGYQAYRLMGSNFVSRDGEAHYVYVYPHTTLDSLLSTLQKDYTIGSWVQNLSHFINNKRTSVTTRIISF